MSRPDDSQPPDGTVIGSTRNLHKDAATIDNYQLLECIGEGSFGQVWKAKKAGVEVALKILKTSMTSEETQREIKSLDVLQELKHPYLVQTYDFWSNGDQLFIEMELANGGSLKDRLKAWHSVGKKGIPEGELLKYFGEIAEALDYLHGQRPRRFLHRDVKPANILIVGGVAKLADFGLLRKVAGDNTGTKTQGGTPVFMAPESIKSDVFSPRTDLYSLAVTYAELRQGKLPFSGSTEYQVCNNILSSLPELGDELYPGERAALLKALDKDPNQRHASCGEFVAALKAAIPQKEQTDVGQATVMPAPVTMIDSGTAPRNVLRRSATKAPRQAAETQAAAATPPVRNVPAPPRKRSMATPLLVALALTIVAGMGVSIWLVLNRGGSGVVPVPHVRKMEIKTTPAGATVYVDDKKQEQKTNGAFEVPAAPFQLRVSLAEHKDVVQRVNPNQSTLDITLEKLTSPPVVRKLEIKTKPSGAIVHIDGKRQNQLTDGVYDVPNTPFLLRLVLADHKVVEQTIEPGKVTLEFKLEPIKAPPIARKLEINSNPPGATVLIDGKEQERKTNGTFDVPIGSFKLRLELPGHKGAQQSIGPDQRKLEIALVEIPSRPYALLIGVNQPTKQLPDFLHAEADVVELGRALVAGGYQASDIQILTQGNDAARPTAARIRQGMSALLKNATDADTLVVALAGHIVVFPGERANFFCPAECDLSDKNSLIALDEIYKQLQRSPARNKLLLLDGWRTDLFPPPNASNIVRDRGKDLQAPAGVILLTSCSSDERGNEHPLLRHGLFYHALIRGLQGAGSVGPNRQITIEMLLDYMTRQVREDAAREYKLKQTPELVSGEPRKIRMQFVQTDVLLQVNLGTIALEEKKYDEALARFNEAAVKNPAYLDLYTGRALAHYFKGKEDVSHYEQATQDCERVLKMDANNGNAHGYLAQIAAARAKRSGVSKDEAAKEFQLALEQHDREIKADPQWAMAYNARGVTQAMRKEYALAIKDYTEAIRLNPKLKFPYENRGFAYTTQKNYESALKDFDKAIELNPNSALNYARRGGAQRILGHVEHALDDLNKAVELDAANANYFYSRAVIQVARKDFGKAIDDFTDTLLLIKQPDKETLYGRGFAYNEKGVKDKNGDLYDKAIQDLSDALKLSPKYVPALYVRGVAYRNKARLKMNDEKLLDLAIMDFDQAIELSPKHANAYFARGLAHRAKGQKALGDADIKMARQLDPKVGETPDGR